MVEIEQESTAKKIAETSEKRAIESTPTRLKGRDDVVAGTNSLGQGLMNMASMIAKEQE